MTTQHGKSGGPLEGVRVLDLSMIVMGPYATQILGDQGAEVITIEPLEGGSNRGMGPGVHREFSGVALNLLRNKRSVALDLKDARARDALLKLARGCDVVVTNMRPKALAGLRLTYEDFRGVRPDIVYCHAQGFPMASERADDPAYDDIIQSESGVPDATLKTGRPAALAPTIMADKVCGMAIANAVLAALLRRERSGEGQRVEVPMADVMKAFMLVEHGAGAISSDAEPAGYSRVLAPERGPQETLDGWINILPYSSSAYDALFAAGGRDDLIGDARTRGRNMMLNADFLYKQLRPIIRTRTTEDWLAFCKEHQIPVGKIASLDELVRGLPRAVHPEAGSYRLIPNPVNFFTTPCPEPRPAPGVGQDTEAVLRAAGLSDAELGELLSRGAARASKPSANGSLS